MGQLLFKKVFWDAIRAGTKRTTIRRWTSARLKAGQRAWTPGVGWLAIESVERVEHLEQLTDTDAAADGFSSAAEMLAALRSLYPAHRGDGRAWFRVAFRPEAVATATAAATPTTGAPPPPAASAASSAPPPAPTATPAVGKARPPAASQEKRSQSTSRPSPTPPSPNSSPPPRPPLAPLPRRGKKPPTRPDPSQPGLFG